MGGPECSGVESGAPASTAQALNSRSDAAVCPGRVEHGCETLRREVALAGRRREVRSDASQSIRASRRVLTSRQAAPATTAGYAMYASIHNITFDCADARAQAAFWAAVTGWAAQERDATPGHVEYTVVPPAPGLPRLYFTAVPEPKRAKNRIRLDLIPPGGDQRAELARPTGLGATVPAAQPPGVGWVILADPEGNEFCLEG
jgi:catechol 2,3-dioxygenase-like lactoylglutathione lyase family enzyme